MEVVPTLNKTEKGDASLGLRAEGIAIHEFTFQGGKETFAPGVVKAIAGRAHRRAYPSCLTALAKGDGGVLAALVGMMNHVLRSTLSQGPMEGIQHQLGT